MQMIKNIKNNSVCFSTFVFKILHYAVSNSLSLRLICIIMIINNRLSLVSNLNNRQRQSCLNSIGLLARFDLRILICLKREWLYVSITQYFCYCCPHYIILIIISIILLPSSYCTTSCILLHLKEQCHGRYHDFWPKFTKFKL